MKKWILLLLAVALLCGGCKPEEDSFEPIGSEDGGGSGYGVSAKSVLNLSDFYFLTQQATRENNTRLLGTPMYTLDNSDTYLLEDGSRIVLTYNDKGVLESTMFTDIQDSKNYSLFDILVREGVLKESALPENNGTAGQSGQSGQSGTAGQTKPNPQSSDSVFSKGNFKKSAFDSGLSLYLDRTSVVATFGNPSYFIGRSYTKDSYIIDCYKLDNGGVLMLDYGFDRKSLRCAAIRGGDGITTSYLGTWSTQTKPADFVRPRIQLNQVTTLAKEMTPEKVYKTLGEPCWFEGSATSYQDVYLLDDGSTVYLMYDSAREKLMSARQLTVENKLIEVTLQ